MSLDVIVTDHGETLASMIPEPWDGYDPYEDVEDLDLWNLAHEELSAREEQVLRLYYVHGMKQGAIGEMFGITSSRVSQIVHEAHRVLQKAVA
jgi:RNA polymerase sigma factor (sigma-70 family)